jgi:hypothetical protein
MHSVTPVPKTRLVPVAVFVPVLLASALAACGGSSGGSSNVNTKCQPGTATALNASCDPAFTQTTPNQPGSIEVTFSGETLGVNGLPFVPVTAGDPVFVDGWNISFDEVLVVLGNFRLAPGATTSPDQSVVGTPVATKAGPYVVDMHKPAGFVGKDGVEPAGGIFAWYTTDSGGSFDTGTRYAFSYDVLKAVYPATQVNLTSDQFADYDLMVQKGYSKLYRGTATYVGTGTYPDATLQAKFAALPTTVHFVFGWDDATSAVNCINADFGDGEDLANRGLQPTSSGAVIAQVTLHVDHAFWDVLKQEGAPLRFDPLAAWAPAGTTAGSPFDLRSLSQKPLATTFADGTPLPDRAPYQNVTGGYTSDQSNPLQVTLGLNGVPSGGIPGIANFMAFSAQSQMHLNANGLCYIVGQHAADPYFVPSIP